LSFAPPGAFRISNGQKKSRENETSRHHVLRTNRLHLCADWICATTTQYYMSLPDFVKPVYSSAMIGDTRLSFVGFPAVAEFERGEMADTQPVVFRADVVAQQYWCGVVDRDEDVQGAIIVEIVYRHSSCS
jgi:hypothetical protein